MLQDPNKSNTDIEAYYDSAIEKALNDGNHYLAMDIIVQKIGFLVVEEGDCDKATKYFESIDMSPYSDQEKNYLETHSLSMIYECTDANSQPQPDESNSETGGE